MSEVIEWLESDEGVEWSRHRSETGPVGASASWRTLDPADPGEDPAGRPHPRLGETAATEGAA